MSDLVLGLKRVFDNPGDSLPFEFEMDLSEGFHAGRHPIPDPVHIQGKVENRAGIVTLGYLATFTLNTLCDRCLTPIVRPYSLHFEHVLVEERFNEEDDELIVCQDASLELDDLIASDIFLELPITILCRDDCKGLCPICGTNLNESSCGCVTKQVDPRLAVLQQLLEEDN